MSTSTTPFFTFSSPLFFTSSKLNIFHTTSKPSIPMASVFDFQDEETPKQKQSSSSSSTTEVVVDGPFDDVLKPILEQESPLKVVELVIDFLRRKSDLFKDESVEKKINGLVTAAKKKDVEEGKKKAEEEEFNDETIVYREKHILSCNQPDRDDGGPYENLDEDAVAMIEETHSVQPLTDAAKQDLVERYKDVAKFYDELLNLPLAGIEAIFSSDDLLVASEDAVYDFMLKWARTHFPKVEDRREVLGTRLGRLIRFPFMTCRKLKKVLTCSDFEHDLASRVVLEALFFKDEAPHRQRSIAAEESASINRRFVERAYKYRPVKVVEFEHPRQHCVVFLELKREECAKLYPSGRVYSQAFYLGGQGFFLSGHCNKDQLGAFNCFGLFLGMQEKGSVSFGIEYKFLARSKPSEEYVSKYKGSYIFSGGKAVGYRNLFQIQWETFMADESNYFINDILHLSVELDQL